MDFFGQSDPYFLIQKSTEDNQYLTVYQSETIMSNLNPVWKPFKISIAKLCNGDYQRTLKVIVYDWNKYSQPELIGECETNLDTILKGATPIKLVNKNRKKGKEHTGDIVVKTSRVVKNYSFLEYLAGGLTMSLIVAVDCKYIL